MCYSFTASVITGILSYSTIIFLLIRNRTYRDRWNALFLCTVGTMQWLDAALWYLHNNGEDLHSCSHMNHIITKIALTTIMLEPNVQLWAYLYYYVSSSMKTQSKMSVFVKHKKKIIFYLFLFIFVPCTARLLYSSDNLCRSWANNSCCSIVTKGYENILYGNRDSNNGYKCWNRYLIFGEAQDEIPFVLRLAFLCGIIYPYFKCNPLMPGLMNAMVVTLTWILGYFSESHASVWCWAATLISIIVILDPYLFPVSFYNPKQQVFNYHKIGTVEGKKEKKQSIKILQARYHRKKVPNKLDAIIIGSGIGGLTTGALLSLSGKKVLILEQHYRAGGCLHTFDEFGGEFDSGIHYVGSISYVKFFLSFITSKLVEWYAMGTNSNNIYDTFDLDGNNDLIRYRNGKNNLMSELKLKFPKDIENIDNYFSFVSKYSGRITYIYTLSKLFPNWSIFRSKESWIYRTFIEPNMCWAKLTANQVLDRYFSKNKKLHALLGGGQLIDWCLIPSEVCWWVTSAMLNYYMEGAYYPMGGSNTIAQSIISLIIQNGGQVLCRAQVDKIFVDANKNQAYAVRIKNRTADIIYAPLIISGVGAHTLYNELLSTDVPKLKEELSKLEIENILIPSIGHMTCFVTLKGTAEDLGLPDYNIHSYGNLAAYDYDISRLQKLFYSDPIKYGNEALICLTFQSAKDPYYDVKFPGYSNALLLTEAKWEWFSEFGDCCDDNDDDDGEESELNMFGKRNAKYLQFKESFKDMFIERLKKYCPLVNDDNILSVEIGSPLSSKHYLNTYKGGSYGLSWTCNRLDHELTEKYLKPETNIDHLYVTGESSLFGGFCGALCSGYVTAVKILGVRQILKILLTTTRIEE